MAIKAKLKRFQNGTWQEYYPETTTDQVVGLEQFVEDNAKQLVEYEVILSSANWENEEPFSQTVVIEGILEEDNPIVDIAFTGIYLEDANKFLEWTKVYRITTQEDAITAFAIEQPLVDIHIKLMVFR